jgi:hypothetical protein
MPQNCFCDDLRLKAEALLTTHTVAKEISHSCQLDSPSHDVFIPKG